MGAEKIKQENKTIKNDLAKNPTDE
jgi:hypothetical protein